MKGEEIRETMRRQQEADDSLTCHMCDTLGVAGPCKKHKDDPLAGVIDASDPYRDRFGGRRRA